MKNRRDTDKDAVNRKLRDAVFDDAYFSRAFSHIQLVYASELADIPVLDVHGVTDRDAVDLVVP